MGECFLVGNSFISEEDLLNNVPFSLNSGNVDNNGRADILNAPGSGTVIETVTTPVMTSSSQDGYTVTGTVGYFGTGTGEIYSGETGTITFPNAFTVEKIYVNQGNSHGGSYYISTSATLTFYDADDTVVGTYTYNPKANQFNTLTLPTPIQNVKKVFHSYGSGSSWGGDGGGQECRGVQFIGSRVISVSTADVLYFNVGGSYPQLTATTGSRTTFTRGAISSINISTYSDGIYNCFITDNTTELLSNTIYRQANQPSTPSTGDVWFNTQEPTFAYKYGDSNWYVYEGVPIGRIIISSGVITKVIQTDFASAYRILGGSLAFPSSDVTKRESLILGSSGTDYTTPANGWYFINKLATGEQYVKLNNMTAGLGIEQRVHTSGESLCAFLPASKGDTVQVTYDAGGITQYFHFIYAKGSESEVQ